MFEIDVVVGAESGPSKAWVNRVTLELDKQRFSFEPILAREIARRLNPYAKVASSA